MGRVVNEAPQSAAAPSPFPPIADYAFLSNCHTGALVAPDGSITGSFVVVERNNRLSANVRDGLRLYMIRPQLRGISLILDVDLKKVPQAPSLDVTDARFGMPNDSLVPFPRP